VSHSPLETLSIGSSIGTDLGACAHPRLQNGLSSKIVAEAGFKGIWASGLSISAALGVRDNNEASWTQIVEAVEYMQDAVDIPILLDGDTGFGNYNNARRLIKKLESRGIAGVCLEDKLYPKANSFIDGEMQPLADIHEFCGKIMACKDTQKDEDFNVVARLESFITGHGLDEAFTRAEAYHKAGADAILCHSKRVVSHTSATLHSYPLRILTACGCNSRMTQTSASSWKHGTTDVP
jgi:phosphoenolpyruvate phosphomutase